MGIVEKKIPSFGEGEKLCFFNAGLEGSSCIFHCDVERYWRIHRISVRKCIKLGRKLVEQIVFGDLPSLFFAISDFFS